MNKWVFLSIGLAKRKFYLDKLLEIYPPKDVARGKIIEKESPSLKQLFQEKKCEDLLRELIRLKKQKFKFPIENPYIGFFSHFEDAISKNPKTVKMICQKIFEMNYEELKEKIEAPKKASRRIGPMFKEWLKRRFEYFEEPDFKRVNNLGFLKGGDKSLKIFAQNHLGCKFKEFSKGLDFVAKIKEKYIIGTAKFITDFGGSQDNQFKEAISLIKETHCPENVLKVAIIDGVAWLGGEMKSTLVKLKNNEYCFSALLLEKFLKEELNI